MKYMTFNNSCFFAALANILEKGGINIEDKDIIKDSLIPFVFKKAKKTDEYIAGYDVQDDDIISDYLSKYGLRFVSKKFVLNDNKLNKRNLIEDIKDKKNVIVSLKVLENNNWHATIFVRYKEPHYIFKNMKRVDSKETDYYMFTFDELIEKLADKVQYGYIVLANPKNSVDKSTLLSDSLVVLNEYKSSLLKYCNELYSHKERTHSRDKLFRALLLNYLDLAKLVEYNEIVIKLSELQKQYLNSFKNVYDMKISTYLDIDLLEEVFNEIIDKILDELDN